MNTEEGNVLIAESPFVSDVHKLWMKKLDEIEGHHKAFYDKAQFHSSWDWLMPVVEKIKNSGDYYSKRYVANIGNYPSEMIDNIDMALMTVDKETVLERVIKFIQWYNTNQLNNPLNLKQ